MLKKILVLISIIVGIECGGQTLKSKLQTIFNENDLMGMSVYAFSGTNEVTHNFGKRDINKNLLVDNNTKYRIASVSKSFTALGLMKLFDKKKFLLDDDISTYLGYTVRNPRFPNSKITFRMLLSHTSSLQDGAGYNPFTATLSQNPIPNIKNLILPTGNAYSSSMWRTETPGNYFVYSNLNYGLIATLIEKISNVRFDIYMKNEILLPLGITGSYNVRDISPIVNVATIYRKPGSWVPQVDDFNGNHPVIPANLTGYVPGTNGLSFGPQGSLRISVGEVGKFLKFIRSNGLTVPQLISENTIKAMKTAQWTSNGSNGQTLGGIFNKYGLGLHFSNTIQNDFICNKQTLGDFIGHPGEAYGLISDAYFSVKDDKGFVFATNGVGVGIAFGSNAYYSLENKVFDALCSYFSQTSSSRISDVEDSDVEDLESKIILFPNPSNNFFTVKRQNSNLLYYELVNSFGKIVIQRTLESKNNFQINTENLYSGIYTLKIQENNQVYYKKIIVNHKL